MNSKRILGGILAVAIAGGIGVLANAVTTNDSSSADPKPATSSTIDSPNDLVLEPGAAGPITIGTSRDDALDSGLFVNGEAGVDGCPAPPLAWNDTFAEVVDVQALENGEIVS